MADPVSLAASIAGLISLADLTFRYSYKYGRTAAGSEQEVKTLATEINALSSVLRSLEALASDLEDQKSVFEPTLRVDYIGDCQRTLEKIKKRVDKAENSFKKDRSKLIGVARSLKWPFSATETKDLLASITRHKGTMTLAMSADSIRMMQEYLSKQIEHDKLIKQNASVLLQISTKISLEGRERRVATVLDFFLRTNPQENLDQSLKLRQPSTGLWLTKLPEFTDWLNTPESKLWLRGMPGGGKTVLAGTVIEEAMIYAQTNSNVGVAFFFCDYKNQETLKPVNILGALASQLARQRDDAYAILEQYYEELHPARALNKQPDPEHLREMITEMSEAFSQVIIVIDGLDECGDDENISNVLVKLLELSTYGETCTMAIFSRDEAIIRETLEDDFEQILITAHTEDVELYVRAEVMRRMQTGRLEISNIPLRQDIENELIMGANGMFRWVVCQLDYLGELGTEADQRQALKELPPSLHESYLRLLERVNKRPPRVRKVVRLCLHFIASYPARLSILELRQAVSTPDFLGSRLDDTNTVSERNIALWCSSFIRLSADGGSFEFAHFSVREFLSNGQLSDTRGLEGYDISGPKSNSLLAQQCVRFIQMRNFDRVPDNSEKFLDHATQIDKDYPFYGNAAVNWLQLTKDGLNDPQLLNAVKALFKSYSAQPGCFYNWVSELFWDISHGSEFREIVAQVVNRDLRPIHIAAALNIPEICLFLIAEGCDCMAECYLGTPLYLAQTLLYELSPQEDVGDFILSPRYMPSTTRRNKTIDCIIEAGSTFSSLHSCTGEKDSPIFYFVFLIGCQLRDFTSLTTLLKHEITPHAREINMIQDFLDQGDAFENLEEISGCFLDLINSLRSIEVYDNEWGLALGKVLWSASLKMNFAFTNDASLIDSRISLSHAALLERALIAIKNDDVTGLEMCLKDGRVDVNDLIDLDDMDSIGGTLLHYAVAKNAVVCTRRLMELGSDPRKEDTLGNVPLQGCPVANDGSILKVLFAHNVSLLSKNAEGWTLWHDCAAYNTTWSFLNVLFHLDPEASQQALLMTTNAGNTPLMQMFLGIYEDLSDVDDPVLNEQEKAIFFIDYCHQIPDFFLNHGPIFPGLARFGSAKVLRHVMDLGLKPEPLSQDEKTPLHQLSTAIDHQVIELLKTCYPEALDTRYEDRLPLELFILTAIKEPKDTPSLDMLSAFTTPNTFQLKDSNGIMPWEFVCGIGAKDLRMGTVTHAWKASWDAFNGMWPSLVELKAMEAYEDHTESCGLLPLFSGIISFPGIDPRDDTYGIPPSVLDRTISKSKYWDPFEETATRFLIERIEMGDQPIVQLLLDHGANVHQRWKGASPIERICQGDTHYLNPTTANRALVECLLDHTDSAKLQEFHPEAQGFSILHRLASVSMKREVDIEWMMRQLVEKGADVNAVSDKADFGWRRTPLSYYLQRKLFYLAGILLDLGADPSRVSDCSYMNVHGSLNAVNEAALAGGTSFLRKLRDFSNAKNIRVDWARTMGWEFKEGDAYHRKGSESNLHAASLNGHHGCVEFFVEEGLLPVDILMEGGYTPLHLASRSGQTSIIEYLVRKGASVNLATDEGRTALHFAASGGHLEAVKALSQLGAVESLDKQEKAPKTYAMEGGHHGVVDFLAQADKTGSSVDPRPSISPARRKALLRHLKLAIHQNNLKTCNDLFTNGCPLDVRMPDCGMWPLYWAATQKKTDVMKWLLEHGADPMKCGLWHWEGEEIVVDMASIMCCHPELNSLLPKVLTQYLQSGGDWIHGDSHPLAFALSLGNYGAVQIILKHLAENAQRIGSMSQIKPDDVIKTIIDRPFLTGKRHICSTPMQVAAYSVEESQQVQSLELLLKQGAEIDNYGGSDISALDLASKSQTQKLLVNSSASLNPIFIPTWKELLAYHERRSLTDILAMCKTFDDSTPGVNIKAFDVLDESHPTNTVGQEPTLLPAYERLIEFENAGISLQGQFSDGTTYAEVLMLRCRLQSFILNHDGISKKLARLPWHWLYPRRGTIPSCLSSSFQRFRRRFAFESLKSWLNLEPSRGWSPLCLGAIQEKVEVMENCLKMGANIDFEGSSLGSALMIASACGRLNAVKFLVRNGAAVNYLGRKGPINAFSVARSKTVRKWLLVGRFNEQLRLEASNNESTACPNQEIRPWSGIVTVRFKIIGRFERRRDQSLLEYATFLADLRRKKRGTVIISTLIEEYIYPPADEPIPSEPWNAYAPPVPYEPGMSINRIASWGSESSPEQTNQDRTKQSAYEQYGSAHDSGISMTDGLYHQVGELGFVLKTGVGAERV